MVPGSTSLDDSPDERVDGGIARGFLHDHMGVALWQARLLWQ
jgi:hypothetical protein